MKIDEFMATIKEIENFYGKELSDEQKQIWFKELRNIDIKRFKYITSQVYRTLKFIPKLADILDINANLGYSQAVQEENHIMCKKCNGTGYITYKKVIDNGVAGKIINEYGAICECKRKPKYEGWKITDEEHRTNYYTPYIQEIGG